MVVFAGFSVVSAAYSILYAIHSIRCRRAFPAAGAILLALISLALAALMLSLVQF